MRRLVSAALIILFFLVLGYILLIYATGKRLSNGKLVGVGIIQVDSTPDNAKVYLNGEFKDDGDINIENLRPGSYTIKVEADNYNPWQKEIEVVEGKISPIKVKLFPSNPSLTAATFNGVYSPRISPDGQKVAFGIQSEGKRGIWVLPLEDRQFFFNNNTVRQVVSDNNNFTFSNSAFIWSPDSSQLLVETKNNTSGAAANFLLNQSQLNTNPESISSTRLAELQKTWSEQVAKTNTDKLEYLGSEAEALNVNVKEMLFSRDNSAVILIHEDQTATVYDTKPSPVPGIKPLKIDLPAAEKYFWFQDGTKHIVAVEKNLVSIMDTDGTNKASIFTGDFVSNEVFSWPDGTRLVLALNLNSRSNPLPNLYTIDLR